MSTWTSAGRMSRPAEGALQSFFERAADEHAAAMASAGEVEFMLSFGGKRVRMRFAGDALAECLIAALRPRLIVDDDDAPLHATIDLWEESQAPGGALPVPWTDADIAPRGLVSHDDEAIVAIHEAGSLAVTLVDRESRTLLYRVPDVAELPWWERAAPLRPALFWALSEPGRHLVHGGAVGDERGGVLLAGAGGSGKTTVALAALDAGMAYVADDYLLLDSTADPVAWNLFGTAKLDAGHVARFPGLSRDLIISAEPVADEKSVLDVDRLMPDALVDSLAIRAILVPRIRGGEARLRPASAGEALLALAPSTAFQMPYDGGEVMGALAGVVRAVPAFALDVGDDQAELARAVTRVLDAVEHGVARDPISEGLAR
jgi:hypothetical protein